MTSEMVVMIIALVILVAFSAFFSATETAYTGFSEMRMRRFAKTKRTARIALKLSKNYNRILTTLLIGNNIVNITASTVATLLFVGIWGEDLGAVLSTVIVTVVVLIFGEVTPKTIAKAMPESFACFAAYPLLGLSILFFPLAWLFGKWEKLIFRIFRLNKNEPKYTEEEFKMLVSDVKEDGVLNDTEHELIRRTLRFDDLHVGSCMIPLDRVIAVNVYEHDKRILNLFRDTNFSRVPVYEGEKRNIVGVLYRADFYEHLLMHRKGIVELIRPVTFTTTDTKLSALLKQTQAERIHMIIVGESGNALGLITREDMIEELLGDVDDKYDMTPVTSPLNPVVPEAASEDEE